MDPSYANGVGAQGPQIPQSSMPSQTPIISSGSGDVVVGGGAPQKKSNKGAIVLVVVMILIGLVGCGYLLWQNGVLGGGGGNSAQQVSSMQSVYNNYVNYVLWGVESDGKPELSAMEEATPYFQSLESEDTSVDDSSTAGSSATDSSAGSVVNAAMDNYLQNVEAKFAELEAFYSQQVGDDKVDLSILKTYYQDFAKIQSLTEMDVLNTYLEKGRQAAERIVAENFETTNNDQELAKYITARKTYITDYLNLVIAVDEAGCINNGVVADNCRNLTEEEMTRLNSERSDALDEAATLGARAVWAIGDLYVELYGEPTDDMIGDGQNE